MLTKMKESYQVIEKCIGYFLDSRCSELTVTILHRHVSDHFKKISS